MTLRAALRACLVAVVVVLGASAALAVAAPPAFACSCAVEATGPQALARSEIVFEGRAVESAGDAAWAFQVDRVYRGTVTARQVVVTGSVQEASCGRSFSLGRTYLVDGRTSPGDPAEVVTGLCSSTRDVADETPADRQSLVRVLGPGTPVAAAAPPPVAAEPDTSPLVAIVLAGVGVAVALAAATVLNRRRRRRDRP